MITYNQMVVSRVEDEVADALFGALSDTTRRDILLRTMGGDMSISALARLYPMSFAAVQKHVTVLERAGLVTKEKRGREQLVKTNIEAIRKTQRLLAEVEEIWLGRLDRFRQVLDESTRGTRDDGA